MWESCFSRDRVSLKSWICYLDFVCDGTTKGENLSTVVTERPITVGVTNFGYESVMFVYSKE